MSRGAPLEQPYMAERWFSLLLQAVAEDPRGKAGVAERLLAGGAGSVGRTQLSLVLNGRYPASTERLAAKVLAVFDRHHCPYLGEPVLSEYCLQLNRGPVPTWDPSALDNRRACRVCAHRPGPETPSQPSGDRS